MRSGSKCKIRRKQAIWLYLFGRELFQFFYSSFAWIQIPEFVIVVQLLSHVRLWDLMDCSMPVFPVLHYLLEFAQMHVHCVGDAIQPSHPLLLPSLPALNLSQPQGLVFSNESALCIRWTKYWSFSYSISPSSEYLGLITLRIGLFDLLLVQRLSRFMNRWANTRYMQCGKQILIS